MKNLLKIRNKGWVDFSAGKLLGQMWRTLFRCSEPKWLSRAAVHTFTKSFGSRNKMKTPELVDSPCIQISQLIVLDHITKYKTKKQIKEHFLNSTSGLQAWPHEWAHRCTHTTDTACVHTGPHKPEQNWPKRSRHMEDKCLCPSSVHHSWQALIADQISTYWSVKLVSRQDAGIISLT